MKKYYADHGNALVDKQKQNEWINKVRNNQEEIFLDATIVEPDINSNPDYEKISYRISEKGTIVCVNGDNINIIIHSAHEDPEIGDISLAWCNRRVLYINRGHICGGLINFMSTKAKIPLNASEFFKRFYSDTDDKKWIRYR